MTKINRGTSMLLACASLALISLPQPGVSSHPNQLQGGVTGAPAVYELTRDQLTAIRRALKNAMPAELKFSNADPSPVTITKCEARSVKLELPPGSESPVNDYVLSFTIKFTNTGQHTITGIRLEFASKQTKFYVSRSPISIEPAKTDKLNIDLMCVTGDPADLTIHIVGAELNGGIIWGDFPLPPGTGSPSPQPRPARAAAESRKPSTPPTTANRLETPGSAAEGATPPDQLQVVAIDQRPVPINASYPRYTEQARQNRVTGTVVLRILVGADGIVKRAWVIRSLPDFLTEQAIKAAFELRFKPAMKNGQPVAYPVPVNIEFVLR
jgi:TonB family protein